MATRLAHCRGRVLTADNPGGQSSRGGADKRRETPLSGTELERATRVVGARPGDHYVRLQRADLGAFRRVGPGRLEATRRADQAVGRLGRAAQAVRWTLIGWPLDTEAMETERLPVVKALPILASDALSSVAYGPEAGLLVLASAGTAALLYNIPIGIAVAILMLLVTISYRQVVRGYQGGGGSYAVARANLGLVFGLVAAAALLVDYVLTVSVSVSSGVDALVSAFGVLAPIKLLFALGFIALLMLGNLRGVREAGAIFAGPTYLFVGCMLTLIVVGLIKGLFFGGAHHPIGQYAPIQPTEGLAVLLVLTAFASASSSMTGIEAVSNSVPSFRPPAARNAARTLAIIGGLLIVLFLGVVALDLIYGAEANRDGNPTVLAQLAAAVFQGPGRPFFYVIQFATTLVLILAANTSFNGFPRLSAILAGDHFLPHGFAQLGDRLVYSGAIVFLAAAAAALLVAFRGNVDALINLYALGVFTAFTLAQSGMTIHWLKERKPGWLRSLAINASGAVVTALVDVVIIVTKAPRGAWVVLIIVPALVLVFLGISRHYARIRALIAADTDPTAAFEPGPVVVPAIGWSADVYAALDLGYALGRDLVVMHWDETGEASRHVEKWVEETDRTLERPPRLRRISGGRRGRVGGFLRALDELHAEVGLRRTVTVVLPQQRSRSVWHELLRAPHLIRLKLALLRRYSVVAASLPSDSGSKQAGALDGGGHTETVAIVPVEELDAAPRYTLAYATSFADHVLVVHVATKSKGGGEQRSAMHEAFDAWKSELDPARKQVRARLVQIDSPYRSVIPPLLAFMDSFRRANPNALCVVVLPEVVVPQWWALIGLHNHRAFWLKSALLDREEVAVADVTYHVGHEPPALRPDAAPRRSDATDTTGKAGRAPS